MVEICIDLLRATSFPLTTPSMPGSKSWTEAVDLALRHLAGQPMTRDEALAMRGAHALDEIPADADPWPGA